MGSEVKFHPSPSAFIGRESELAELRVGLDDAIAGHGRLFLISGEPGIGKTRTTNELALQRVPTRGAGCMGPVLGGAWRPGVLALDSNRSRLRRRSRLGASECFAEFGRGRGH